MAGGVRPREAGCPGLSCPRGAAGLHWGHGLHRWVQHLTSAAPRGFKTFQLQLPSYKSVWLLKEWSIKAEQRLCHLPPTISVLVTCGLRLLTQTRLQRPSVAPVLSLLKLRCPCCLLLLRTPVCFVACYVLTDNVFKFKTPSVWLHCFLFINGFTQSQAACWLVCSPAASTELAAVLRSCVNTPAKSGGASPLHQVLSQAALVLVSHNKSLCVCVCGAPV